MNICTGRTGMDINDKRIQKQIPWKTVAWLLLAFLLISSLATASETTRAFHWVDDEDYPPIIYRGADGKPAGIFYEIITEAFHRLDIPLRVEVYPWVRAQKIVAGGEADGMVTILTEARKKVFLGSDPILQVCEYIFFHENNSRKIEIMSARSLNDIRSFKIVETIGSGWTQENLKGFDITWVPDMNSAFNMMIKGRVDLFILNNLTGSYFIQKKIKQGGLFADGYKKILTSPYSIQTLAYRLLIRKDSPFANRIDDINTTIHRMEVDGTVQHIIEEAHLTPRGPVCNTKR